MNTRLQVEHPVTELVTGIDLVEQQLLIAADESVTFDPASVTSSGMRSSCASTRRTSPLPAGSRRHHDLARAFGEGVRVDAGYAEGNTVTPAYDPLLAKLCVWDVDRAAAPRPGPVRSRDLHHRGTEEQLAVLRRAPRRPCVHVGRVRHQSGRPDAILSPESDKRRTREESRVAEEVRAEMVANVWKIVVARRQRRGRRHPRHPGIDEDGDPGHRREQRSGDRVARQ